MDQRNQSQLAAHKSTVVSFLNHCLDYADQKLADYQQRDDNPQNSSKIQQWQTYRAFTHYTIHELQQTSRLDGWLTAPQPLPPDKSGKDRDNQQGNDPFDGGLPNPG